MRYLTGRRYPHRSPPRTRVGGHPSRIAERGVPGGTLTVRSSISMVTARRPRSRRIIVAATTVILCWQSRDRPEAFGEAPRAGVLGCVRTAWVGVSVGAAECAETLGKFDLRLVARRDRGQARGRSAVGLIVYGAASRAPSALSASCAAWNACRPAGVPQ